MSVITKKSLLKVTGPANRSLLTKEILDFCGTFPIYNIETTEAHFNPNGDKTQGKNICFEIIPKYFYFILSDNEGFLSFGGITGQNLY